MLQKRIILFLAVIALLVGISLPSETSANGNMDRISGQDRISTAIEVSKKSWPTQLTTSEKAVILTRADMPYDALASSGLVGVKQAPILLTNPTHLDDRVEKEMDRLNAKKVYILGGTAAISSGIENNLKQRYSVTRLEGSNRFSTAEAINKAAGLDNSTTAIVVNGQTVADALSASSVAAIKQYPIYLTTKTKTPSLPSSIKKVYLVGGESVLTNSVKTSLEQQGKSVTRLYGDDRFQTNLAINKAFFSSSSSYLVVRGTSTQNDREDYPDAVAASGLSKKLSAPIVLSHHSTVVSEVESYLKSNAKSIKVLGGEGALPSKVVGSYESKQATEEVALGTAVVTASSLNVRTAPTTAGTRIGALPRHSEVAIYGFEGDWVKIKYSGQYAYVHGAYLLMKTSDVLNGLTIVVDPGHGDHDPGASRGNLLEKDINLDVSTYLEKKLKQAGANVVMTRRDDTFIELGDRSKMANKIDADSFISVHTNSGPEAAHGIETYWYSKYSSAESKALAESIQKRLIEVTNARDRGVKHASFSVVRESTMAAVLVEVGFLSNNEEYKLLLSQSYREQLADGIYQGVIDYYKN
ncbi:N-acetylmuramoyl-L-alanine amidase [Guptibacillus algicola]|uniref:N-acetylmuramoyl-L-alanine amidase n=1 Tax=Guptibacillus algicola TaxID=225844 RepID=UPI001CD4C20B|nr:N-acetylmuramoyl-L-alanine amidase [Alkalihalobacillus algicola]MCA0988730.1 N-acetylmuramoyl-L-alanine amidase [Alkalihalobacillus algicola]